MKRILDINMINIKYKMTETDYSESTISYDENDNHVINVTTYEHEKIKSFIKKNDIEETLNKFSKTNNTLVGIHDRFDFYQLYYNGANGTKKYLVNIDNDNGILSRIEYMQDKTYKPTRKDP